MPKANLKQKLEGNKLDLSLSELKEVPISDIVSITATIDFYFLNLELSLNQSMAIAGSNSIPSQSGNV